MKELKRKLLSVKNGPHRTTGGNQQLADSRQLRTCGCGIVSSTDMLLYLCNRGEGGGFVRADFPVPVTVDKAKKTLDIWTNLWFDRSNEHFNGRGEAIGGASVEDFE